MILFMYHLYEGALLDTLTHVISLEVKILIFHRKCKRHVILCWIILNEKVQVGKDQEKAQSEKDSHSKNQGGKKTN